MNPDLINGLFEFAGGLFICMNVAALYRDKTFKGVSLWPSAFFLGRSLWDLFYYPHLHQSISLAGDAFYVLCSTTWLALAIKYKRRTRIETETSGTHE